PAMMSGPPRGTYTRDEIFELTCNSDSRDALAASQNRTVPSCIPAAICAPSGDHAAHWMMSLPMPQAAVEAPVVESQIRSPGAALNQPSQPADIRRFPSGENATA